MSAKLSDLRRKLVGAAEQPDVAGKRSRTSRFQSPQSFAASKRSVRAVPPPEVDARVIPWTPSQRFLTIDGSIELIVTISR